MNPPASEPFFHHRTRTRRPAFPLLAFDYSCYYLCMQCAAAPSQSQRRLSVLLATRQLLFAHVRHQLSPQPAHLISASKAVILPNKTTHVP